MLRDMARFDQRLVKGSLSGALSTLAMSVFMLAAERMGWLTEQAPETVTRRSLRLATGRRIEGPQLHGLTAVLHLGFGAGSGALYAATLGRSRKPVIASGLKGALFGTVVWFVSYWGFLPGLGLMPPISEDERRRPLVMLVAHWIYGGVLALLVSAPPDIRRRPGMIIRR
jgi:putative membrane protein